MLDGEPVETGGCRCYPALRVFPSVDGCRSEGSEEGSGVSRDIHDPGASEERQTQSTPSFRLIHRDGHRTAAVGGQHQLPRASLTRNNTKPTTQLQQHLVTHRFGTARTV
jgi:hypothetical protein